LDHALRSSVLCSTALSSVKNLRIAIEQNFKSKTNCYEKIATIPDRAAKTQATRFGLLALGRRQFGAGRHLHLDGKPKFSLEQRSQLAGQQRPFAG
jgi:hypothetical protein